MPSTDQCIRAAEGDPALSGLSHEYLKLMVRRAQESFRDEITAGSNAPNSRTAIADEVMRRTIAIVEADRPRLTAVVNATGVVLHTNLGRAILASAAIDAAVEAARSPVNLEYDLESGGRGDRDAIVEDELRALTGVEAATVVNNNAAAVLLALNSLADGRDVIVSRGELIEIGGSFRIPEVMAKSGARMHEVGTTNRTHLRDYERAVGPDTALLMKVHPSNYTVVGFTATVGLAELVDLGRKRHVDVIEDLGSGALVDMTRWGLPHEPLVAESIRAGAGLVMFSGDKLLGGPQAGIVVGRRDLIAQLKANPLKRALRCDKLTLAALSATLRLYLRSPDIGEDLPTLRLLRRHVSELRQIAELAQPILIDRLGEGFQIDLIESSAQIGSGALPIEEVPSIALRIRHPEHSADRIAAMFRRARPPVIGRIHDGAFLLDLRAVESPEALAVSLPREPT